MLVRNGKAASGPRLKAASICYVVLDLTFYYFSTSFLFYFEEGTIGNVLMNERQTNGE